MQCGICGAVIAEHTRFCSACGAPLAGEPVAADTRRPRQVTVDAGIQVPAASAAALTDEDVMASDQLARLRASVRERYDVARMLGRGGMATVFLATDLKHDREVAIKVLLPELAATLGAERFEREIRLAAKLQHPHILGLFDSGVADGMMYYVMPFVRGESLRDRIDREGMLPIEDALQITLEVNDALGHAHRHGVVHRDIKPENILLADGHALVADFGIARAITEGGAQKLTQTGVSMGTPYYMAPEQASGEAAGPTADLYSLGCVLFEMLAGEPPFTGKNSMAIMSRHAMEQVPSICIVRPAVPQEIEQAIFIAMNKTPADRPQNAEQFAQLLGLSTGMTHTATMRVTMQRRVPTGAQDVIPVSSVPPWWRRPIVVAAAVLVASAGLGGAWLARARDAGTGSDGPELRRLAVLYFTDLSADSSLGPVADGLTEGLTRALGTASSFTVISQMGVEQFRHSTVAPDSIARALRAGFLVRGEVERDGDGIGVNVRLDEASGVSLKRARFRGAAGNFVALRDSLVVVAADLIRQQLGLELRLKEDREATGNSEAWLLLQRGVLVQRNGEAARASGDAAGMRRAFATADSLYAAAEQLDAKWAEPAVRAAALAYRRARLAGGNADSVRAWTAVGLGHANRALARDPDDPDALEVRGNLRYFPLVISLEPDKGKYREALGFARADLERATVLNNRQAGAYATLSHLYYQVPELTANDVYIAAQRAYEADEFLANANLVLWRLFLAAYDLGQFDRARHWCAQAHTRFAGDFRAVKCELFLLTSRSAEPDVASAWRLADSSVALVPPAAHAWERLTADMLVAAVIARASERQPALRDSARNVARRSEGTTEVDPTRDLGFFGAFVYGQLGDKDDAFRMLKQFLAANPDKAEGLRNDPGWWLRPIADDPRFPQLVGSSR